MSTQAQFIARLRSQLADGPQGRRTHAVPPLPASIPAAVSAGLNAGDLLGSFATAARAVLAVVHVVDEPGVPAAVLADIVARHGVTSAVLGREACLRPVTESLRSLGVECHPLDPGLAARADLGVTTAAAGIAATGTLVQDSSVSGGRSASLLPPVHLCLLSRSAIVASTAAFLRPLSRRPALPSNLVLVTGPSRSADIEQTMTRGVHGPVSVEIVIHTGTQTGQTPC
jgi:L-lactate dehydrogenase complex protein LldG